MGHLTTRSAIPNCRMITRLVYKDASFPFPCPRPDTVGTPTHIVSFAVCQEISTGFRSAWQRLLPHRISGRPKYQRIHMITPSPAKMFQCHYELPSCYSFNYAVHLWLYMAHLTKRAHELSVSWLTPERSNRLTLILNRCNKGVSSFKLQSRWISCLQMGHRQTSSINQGILASQPPSPKTNLHA